MKSRNILTAFSNNFLPHKICEPSESITIVVSRPILKAERKQRSFYLLMITEDFKLIITNDLKLVIKSLKKEMKRSSCLPSSSLKHHNNVNCPVINSLSEKSNNYVVKIIVGYNIRVSVLLCIW